eukprot:10499421-Alexandrium_andersonii.AAC.1
MAAAALAGAVVALGPTPPADSVHPAVGLGRDRPETHAQRPGRLVGAGAVNLAGLIEHANSRLEGWRVVHSQMSRGLKSSRSYKMPEADAQGRAACGTRAVRSAAFLVLHVATLVLSSETLGLQMARFVVGNVESSRVGSGKVGSSRVDRTRLVWAELYWAGPGWNSLSWT